MQDIGISVGEWSDNQFANFGSPQQRSIMGGISGFIPKFSTSFRDNREYGDGREIKSRKDTAIILLNKGFSKDDIARMWANYKLDVQSNFDKLKFIAYAERKRIIDKARKEEEDRLYEQGKAEEAKEIINDLNLFPPKENNSPIPNELGGVKQSDNKTNYLVYGLIGLGVIVGAFLIFKKK